MACLFPGAPDLATYARNLRSGVDAIREVPAGRWDPVFYDPTVTAADRFYCKRGGFVDELASFDAVAHGVMPVAARGAEPDQLLALEVATRALADAGLDRRDFDRARTGVIIGRGNYAGAGRTRLEQHVRGAEQLVRAVRALVPGVSEAQLAAIKKEFQAAAGAAGPDGAIGLVPNLTASRIANRLDLGGPAHTVDAACASALIAVDQAVAELRAGRLDVVLAGGVHFCHDEAFWSVFCQLGALSRSQQIRPFDRRADGILIGEGAGLVVLRRVEDAERDGDRIYAIIRGTGVSSDGRDGSLMNPAVDGQVRALERAWRAADVDPTSVGLVEAHGTGTPAGDAAELETLRRVFGEAAPGAQRAVLGSVKSMIGHAMPAAGAAGLIKAAIARHSRELPPTLHCDEPHAALARTRFRTTGAVEPWNAGNGPRRAAVNAFGFGGINAHVVLEEAGAGAARRTRVAVPLSLPVMRALVLAAADPAGLAALLDAPPAAAPLGRAGDGPCRLVVLDPTPERLAKARSVVEKGRPWRGREGIFFSLRGLLADGGKLAFCYPGVDASFRPRLSDVAAHFGKPLAPEAAEGGARTIEQIGVGLVESSRLLEHALGELGLRPHLALGHSLGEWTAMVTTGMVPPAQVAAFMHSGRTGALEVPGVVFAAAGAGVAQAERAMAGLPDIGVSHDNCPHQIILCGVETSIDEALRRLRAGGVLGQKLPFRSGFHSPLFAPFVGPHRANFASLELSPPSCPLYSSTTCAPYPDDADGVRALAVDHLIKPVRFRELVERLHEGGVRAFVQVGTGSLVSFVEDTLRGKEHLSVSANLPDRSGMEQLWRLAAALFVEGLSPRFERLVVEDTLEAAITLRMRVPVVTAAVPSRPALQLALGVPLVELARPLDLPQSTPVSTITDEQPTTAATAEFAELLGDMHRASAEVMAMLDGGAVMSAPAPRLAPRERKITRRLSTTTHPWLLDHTFFRQPPGWPTVSDRHPVVPMTTSIAFMMEEAQALVPELTVVGIEDVRAFRWLAIPQPTEVPFDLRYDGKSRVSVNIEGFAEGVVVLAPGYDAAPPHTPAPRANPRPAPIDAPRMYAERWMFHGPAFQGVREIGPITDDGMRGELETGAAPGALLDNAGQLFGFWVMAISTTDRLAMPIGIERMTFHGPHPPAGVKLECDVRIKLIDARRVVADLALAIDGRVWCEIEGWEDRRFDTDPRLWDVLIWPENHLLGEAQPEGPVRFHDIYRAAPTREQLMRRYLGERERAEYESQPPRGQRNWLAGRIAAKDAARDLLWKRGHGDLFPVEIQLDSEPSGRPIVRAPGGLDLRVSIAHKGELAIAMVAEGRDVGVDVETVEPRPPGFAELAFADEELALIGAGDDRDEWLARLWTAKEAVGKLLGTGLAGNPRKLVVTDRRGERLCCRGHWVETRRDGDHVLAWTTPS